jgi:hypothetical protein
MSRRTRRREGNGNAGWLGRAALVLGAVLVLGAAIGYGLLRNYLHSDGFRLFLSAEVSKAAGVRGEFAPFRWDGLAVDTSRFSAEGEGLITVVNADGLHTEVDLSGVRRGVWQLEGARVNRLELTLDARERESATATATPPPPPAQQQEVAKARKSGWLPDVVEVGNLTVGELSFRAALEQGLVAADGMRVQVNAESGKNAYRAEVEGGGIRLPWDWAPEVQLENASLRHRDGVVFVTDANANVWKNGRITAVGEWNLGSKTFAFEGGAQRIDLADVLDESWAQRLTGDVASSFTFQNRSGSPRANGSLVVTNGVLTALPVLDSLAAYADTTRFRVLPLHEARTDWQWQTGQITLNDLVISSDGLVRLEGRLVIRDRELDGHFKLGLAPGTLASIPGAETHVFLPGERGLRWAPLRITGTLDDPKEDLTDRLIEAAGSRMFEMIPETGERVLKFTRTVIEQNAAGAIDKGVRAVEKGVEAVDKASEVIRETTGGILGGILGVRRDPTPPPAPPEPPEPATDPDE